MFGIIVLVWVDLFIYFVVNHETLSGSNGNCGLG